MNAVALAVVTGSSSGIGLATAVALARAGHMVVATMRDLDRGAEIRQVATDEKLPIHLAAINVDNDDSVRHGFSKIIGERGPIDVLVNNAGIVGGGAIEETPVDVFRQVMETNFFGGLRCIKAVVPAMRERRSGTIVNVTSVAGRIATTPQASYAASKWAFEALCECLAQEMRAFNVRVAIVSNPGSSPLPSSGRRGPSRLTAPIRTRSGSGLFSRPRSPTRRRLPSSATRFVRSLTVTVGSFATPSVPTLCRS